VGGDDVGGVLVEAAAGRDLVDLVLQLSECLSAACLGDRFGVLGDGWLRRL
jgi:hypothetical protein